MSQTSTTSVMRIERLQLPPYGRTSSAVVSLWHIRWFGSRPRNCREHRLFHTLQSTLPRAPPCQENPSRPRRCVPRASLPLTERLVAWSGLLLSRNGSRHRRASEIRHFLRSRGQL